MPHSDICIELCALGIIETERTNNITVPNIKTSATLKWFGTNAFKSETFWTFSLNNCWVFLSPPRSINFTPTYPERIAAFTAKKYANRFCDAIAKNISALHTSNKVSVDFHFVATFIPSTIKAINEINSVVVKFPHAIESVNTPPLKNIGWTSATVSAPPTGINILNGPVMDANKLGVATIMPKNPTIPMINKLIG